MAGFFRTFLIVEWRVPPIAQMRVDGLIIVQDAHCLNRFHSLPPAETGHLLGTRGPCFPDLANR